MTIPIFEEVVDSIPQPEKAASPESSTKSISQVPPIEETSQFSLAEQEQVTIEYLVNLVQMGMTSVGVASPMDLLSPASKRLSNDVTEVLLKWFLEHLEMPYPTKKDKEILAKESQLTKLQIRNWFTNIRKRHWGPVRKGRKPKSMLEMVILNAYKRELAMQSSTCDAPPVMPKVD